MSDPNRDDAALALEDIYRARHLVREKWLAREEAKARYKVTQAEHDEAVAQLTQVIDLHENPAAQEMPLFDGPGDREVPGSPGEVAEDRPAPAPIAAPDGDDRWRAVSIGEIGLKPQLREHLEDADIFTIGQLADWTKTRPLTDIGGIGATKQDALLDALAAFWPRWQAGKVAAPEGPGAKAGDSPTAE